MGYKTTENSPVTILQRIQHSILPVKVKKVMKAKAKGHLAETKERHAADYLIVLCSTESKVTKLAKEIVFSKLLYSAHYGIQQIMVFSKLFYHHYSCHALLIDYSHKT